MILLHCKCIFVCSEVCCESGYSLSIPYSVVSFLSVWNFLQFHCCSKKLIMVSGSGSVSLHGSLQLLHSSAMPAGEKIAPKKLKIKLSKLSSESDIVSAEVGLKTMGNRSFDDVTGLPELSRFSLNSQSGLTTTSGKEKRIIIKNNGDHHVDKEMVISERYNVGVSMTHASKRGHVLSLDNQKAKKQKIDSRVMQQCSILLKKLMAEPFSWVFNQPVDPVALKIPDYFSVISEPMDLGTIKSKVGKKLYTNTEEFAADVRLTFSNAMRYNPPMNDVHIMAKRLLGIFESKWKILVAKWSAACMNIGQQPISNDSPSKALVRRDGHRAQVSRPKVSHKALLSSVQRQKLRKDLVELSNRKIPPSLLEQFRKMGLMGQHDDRIEVDIDAIDEITVCELEKVMRSYHHLRSTEPAHSQYSCGRDSIHKDLHKGNGASSMNVFGSSSEKSRLSSVRISASCESMDSRRRHHTDLPSGNGNSCETALGSASDKQTSFAHTHGYSERMDSQDNHNNNFTSDVDSDRYSGRENNNAILRNLDLSVNDTTSRMKTKSDLDSNGGVSIVIEQNVDHSSHPPTPGAAAASEEGWESSTYDGQLSPSKALRAAMLRSRFADTIVKAQQKALLDNGEKIDPVKLKQEKERLEKRQREEKARIEAQIRAAESAARDREQMELKKQREREREAARITLQKMERTVEIYENLDILKELEELEILAGSPQSDDFSVPNNNPLRRLGLFIKDEYLEDKDDLDIEESENFIWDIEEGENCEPTDKDGKRCNMGLEEGENCEYNCRDNRICNRDVEEGEIAP